MPEEDDPEGLGAPYIEPVPLIDEETGDAITSLWSDEIGVRRLELGGSYLAYVDEGEGEPIVFVPGFMGTAANFAPQIEHFSSTHRVISLDPIGCGLSDRPAMKYKPAEYFRFTRRFIEKLGVWPATIVGHSMGGAVAYALAIDNPELVERLVMLAPRPPIPSKRTAAERVVGYATRRSLKAAEWVLTRAIRLGAGAIARSDSPAEAFDDAGRVRRRLKAIHRQPGSARVGARSLIWMDEWSEWNGRMAEIEAPSLLIWGERDRVVLPANIGEFTAGIRSIDVEMIPKAGHVPMLESAQAVNDILGKFIAGAGS